MLGPAQTAGRIYSPVAAIIGAAGAYTFDHTTLAAALLAIGLIWAFMAVLEIRYQFDDCAGDGTADH